MEEGAAQPVKALVGKSTVRLDLSKFPPSVAEALKVFDVDGDGSITTDELWRGGNEAQSNKHKVRRLSILALLLTLLLFVQLGATFGLVFAVVAVTKDTKVSGSTGALVARDNTLLGTAPVLGTSLTSEMPDADLASARSVSLTLADATLSVTVDGFLRLPLSALGANAAGLTLGPVVLLTPAGQVLLAGDQATPLTSDLTTAVTTATTNAASALASLAGGAPVVGSTPRSFTSFALVVQPAAGTPSDRSYHTDSYTGGHGR